MLEACPNTETLSAPAACVLENCLLLAEMGDMLPQESRDPWRAGSRLWQRSIARFRVLNAHFIYLE